VHDDRSVPLLEMTGISKRFPGVQALDDVDLDLHAGEVLGLVGVNGAGKSTLMNVLGGVVSPDTGRIRIAGREVRVSGPHEAQAQGIAFVHQELSLFANLDIATNVHITRLPRRAGGLLDSGGLRERTQDVLRRVGLRHVSARTLVGGLRPGEQQLVEIARCLASQVRILVLDEPTSSLTEPEVATLFRIVRDLRTRGVGVIYLSHRLDEIAALCDRVAVLRDGRRVATVRTGEVDRSELVRLMLGHELTGGGRRGAAQDRVLLEVRGLGRGRLPRDVSFTLHAGEVLGITGLLGSGRTELARCLFGLEPAETGEIVIDGRPARIRSPRDAIANGIGFLTEDRRAEGLILDKPVRDNIVLADLPSFAGAFGFVRAGREREAAERQRSALGIKAASVLQHAGYLSGGNQQKVVLAKWLQTDPRILLLDEPTRGIDVGAKEEVYRLIADLAAGGAGVVVISSEIDEVTRLSDRVLVMRAGGVVAEFPAERSPHEIMLAAAGGTD
jgi:ribose transport system ATP-binding protein